MFLSEEPASNQTPGLFSNSMLFKLAGGLLLGAIAYKLCCSKRSNPAEDSATGLIESPPEEDIEDVENNMFSGRSSLAERISNSDSDSDLYSDSDSDSDSDLRDLEELDRMLAELD